ncbi:hypothetical protein Sjap_009517 [Stephania japonica]|uniref:Uncharacterized protein n=1 Tax=Stephania japonica TaxID=461633 RepID=A0AAP0PBT0_9MAGN
MSQLLKLKLIQYTLFLIIEQERSSIIFVYKWHCEGPQPDVSDGEQPNCPNLSKSVACEETKSVNMLNSIPDIYQNNSFPYYFFPYFTTK